MLRTISDMRFTSDCQRSVICLGPLHACLCFQNHRLGRINIRGGDDDLLLRLLDLGGRLIDERILLMAFIDEFRNIQLGQHRARTVRGLNGAIDHVADIDVYLFHKTGELGKEGRRFIAADFARLFDDLGQRLLLWMDDAEVRCGCAGGTGRR